MSRIVFNAITPGSESLHKVAEQLRTENLKVIIPKTHASRFRSHPDDLVIHWGSRNKNKLQQYETFKDEEFPHAEFTTDIEVAKSYFANGSKRVLCRTLLNASCGRGIVVAESPEQLVPAPMYVKYVPKRREFRVHYIHATGGAYVTEKKKMAVNRRPDNFIQYIRNHDNGWVFCRNTEVPDEYKEILSNIAKKCCLVFGLDFCAADVGFDKNGNPCLYEVNTQPGLDNETALWYATQIREWHDEIQNQLPV